MSTRDYILQTVASNQPTRNVLKVPEIPVTPVDLPKQFKEAVEKNGGKLIKVNSLSAVRSYLLDTFGIAGYIVNTIPGLHYGWYFSEKIQDGHQFSNVKLAICAGKIGVVENGAIWLTDICLPHRSLPFICQHLALVVNENVLVPTLQEAYKFLKGKRNNYGVFISGPSKTADIEQSLVIGAHGSRSLLVFLLSQPTGE